MQRWIILCVATFHWVGSHHPAWAQTSYPMVTHAFPAAVERGKKNEVTVHGKMNFAGAFEAFIEGEGITAKVVPADSEKSSATSVKLQVTVTEDAALGAREFRIATAQGVSSVGQIVVTDHPVVVETGSHATRETAQPVKVGQLVAGIISGREQVDFFRFRANAGQQVTFSVLSSRLMHKIHDLQKHFDPIVSVFTADGVELASNDDFYFSDSMLSYRFDQQGEYYVCVRDVRFDGDGRWSYCLTLSDRPYVTSIFPMAVPADGSRTVTATGFNLAGESFEIDLPEGARPGSQLVQLESGRKRSNAIVVELTDLPHMCEREPNNDARQAIATTLPACINGRIGAPSDVDTFAFELKKGTAVRFEVKARRNGSALDSQLRLLNTQGAAIAAGDDYKRTTDTVLSAKAPADGTYVLEIRDLLYRGGETFGYVIEATYDEPDFELTCDDDKAGIGPGIATVWFVKLERHGGFTGPVDVRIDGLPKGVTANPLVINPTMTQGCLVLSADAGAEPVFSAVKVFGQAEITDHSGQKRTIKRQAQPVSEIYMPGGGRGTFDVDTQVVGVHANYDIGAVHVTPAAISLKPGEKVVLEVEVKRRENYAGRVTLDTRLRHLGGVFGDPLPPGVRTLDQGSKTSLNENESKGRIVLQADANAKPIENVPIAVLANVSINFVVKRAYSSPPILLSVVDPKQGVAANSR